MGLGAELRMGKQNTRKWKTHRCQAGSERAARGPVAWHLQERSTTVGGRNAWPGLA